MLTWNPAPSKTPSGHVLDGALYAQRTDKTILLAADRSLVYDRVVALMDTCRAAGVERIGVVTGAEKKRGE